MLRAPFLLIWNLLRLVGFGLKWTLFHLAHWITRKKTKWVRLRLPQRLAMGPPEGIAAYFKDTPTFLELRSAIDTLGRDSRIEGVVLSADELQMGTARLGDIRDLVRQLRDQGKQVIFHSHSLNDAIYDLASEADDIVMTPGGRLYLFGPRFEQFFGAALLNRLGITAQFVHIGPFKGAAHRFIHEQTTVPVDRMMENIVDEITDIRLDRIAQGRSIDESTLDQAFRSMPLDDRQAEALELIDARLHRPLLEQWIIDKGEAVDRPPGADAPTVDSPPEETPLSPTDEPDSADAPDKPQSSQLWLKNALAYAEATPSIQWSPLFRSPKQVAVMDLSGMIVMPKMEIPGRSVITIDPHEVLPKLRQIQNNPRIAGALLHINSPGGNALASEMIWDGIRQLRRVKPVVAYCTDVAASGGYYLACGADRIICRPDTITGSIGVVAGKFSIPGALDKTNIGHAAYAKFDTSAFTSLAEPLPDQAMDNLLRDARSFYRQFLRRVGEARQIPRRRLHRYARGRIYSGQSAHRRHLVDGLGGFEAALTTLRDFDDDLTPDSPVEFMAHRRSSLGDLLRQSTLGPRLQLPEALVEAQLLHHMSQAHPLLAIAPTVPTVR